MVILSLFLKANDAIKYLEIDSLKLLEKIIAKRLELARVYECSREYL
jgi:hypothetical protein